MMIATQAAPIGIFDSGVGGLSVLHAIQEKLANEDIIYIADQEHVPYGQRPLEEVRLFSQAITQYFLQNNTKLIVVACNTALSCCFTLPPRKISGSSIRRHGTGSQTRCGTD